MIARLRLAVLLTATLTALLLPRGVQPSRKQLALVSLPDLRVAAGERVVSFHFELTSARIAQIPDVPIGWNISVDNDPSWNTKIDASTIVAAAAVDVEFFKGFVVVEKEQNIRNPFEVKGKIAVSKDFSNVRTIQVGTKDFAITARR